MNAWDHLPNAKHIDWVLASLKQHPEIWEKAWHAARSVAWGVDRDSAQSVAHSAARSAAWDAAWAAAWRAAKGATRAVDRDAARSAARSAAWDVDRDAAWESQAASDAAWYATRGVTLALIAYDDCADLLDMPSEQLKTWALLTEKPAAVLLLSAVIVRERIRELETV